MAVLVLLFLLQPKGAQPARSREGGRLVEAVVGSATSINPLDARASPAERDLAALIFAGLTRPGPDGRPLPALAESWEVSDDARVFTFRLRNRLSWHDGRDLTVDDVLFTVSVLIGMADRADPALLDVWKNATIRKSGEASIRVELPEPFAALPAFASFGLLPAHRFPDAAAGAIAGEEFFRAPIGAGPFRLASLNGERAVLNRFERYALGAPFLDQVELRFVPDAAAARRSMQRGETGAAVLADESDAPLGSIRQLATVRYTAILLNHRSPLFSDPAVRRALSQALDRDAIAARFGGVPEDVPLAPGWWTAPGSGGPGSQSDAASLLAAAGWSRGADGVPRREGRELAFTLVTPSDGQRIELARMIAAMWQQLGARVTVAPTEPSAILRDFLVPRTYQAAIAGIDPGVDADPFLAWHGSLAGSPDGNFSDAADPELDELMTRAHAATSAAERRDLFGKFAARFREVAPGIVLYAQAVRYALHPGLAGVEGVAVTDASWRFADVHRWYWQRRP